MAWYWVATLLFGTALGLMVLGVPVAIGFFATNVLAAMLFMGGAGGIQQLINNGFGSMTNFALVPIPMFLLMGELFYHTGLADRMLQCHRQAARQRPRPARLRHADRRHRASPALRARRWAPDRAARLA